jgi:hypothetical protein
MHAELKTLNLAGGNMTVVAANANVGFAVTGLGDRVIYATDDQTTTPPGIYVAPVW